MSEIRIDKWLLSLFYLLAFFLLREWLIPVMELTETGHLSVFLAFIVLAFLLALLNTKWWFVVPLKIFYVVWVVHYIYFDVFLFTRETISLLINDLVSNFTIIAGGNWENISNPFRTMLFFVLLWMASYLIRHWMETRKSIFLFYVITVVFIALIDTFSAFSAEGSILRIMVTGLFLLGLLSITKLAEKHNTTISSRKFARIAVPLLFVVVISGALVTTLPKMEAVWPDPVPYLKSMVDGTGGSGSGEGISRSGYDPDDSRLGGSFVEDDSLVFEATVNEEQYWKIENKYTYTSKGWAQPNSLEENVTVYYPGQALGEFKDSAGIDSGDSSHAELQMTEKFPFIIYPYGMVSVEAGFDVSFVKIDDTSQYLTRIEENEVSLDSYQLEYAEHEYSLKALRETTMESVEALGDGFQKYLQLPEELPSRVGELAQSITASEESVYDKTKAIERYFGRNGFVYSQRDVPIPEGETDYVDQFLFDTKMGYCDNFSTSMVVMLRSIGIPARWVKGFAPGEFVRTAGGESVYRVTNNEAHSWVEAFMPGVGWMPFEPTIGFGGPASIEYDVELDINDPEVPEMPEQEREQLEREIEQKKVKENPAFDINKLVSSIGSWIGEKIWWILSIVGVVLFTSWRLFIGRRKWLPKILIPYYRPGEGNWEKYAKLYKSLLKQLSRFGLKRKSGDTLLTYAIEVDRHFGGDMMRKLTTAYEKGIYGEDIAEQDWRRLQDVWEDLINRTSD